MLVLIRAQNRNLDIHKRPDIEKLGGLRITVLKADWYYFLAVSNAEAASSLADMASKVAFSASSIIAIARKVAVVA